MDLGIISPLYADNAYFDGSVLRIDQILKLLMERGADWGYVPETAKSMFISDTTEH